jgi:hypothetical protein
VATIRFAEAGGAEFEYTIAGVSGSKRISRQPFGDGAAATVSVGGLWWGGSQQNGWGISVMQQDATLFSVWFTYDQDGQNAWYVMPGGKWTASDTYEGALYRTAGSPLASYDSRKLNVSRVGSYRFRFQGDSTTFEYTIDERRGTLPLSRQAF